MSAFEQLYDRHETGVWRFVFRSVQNHAVTDDLAQELWFSVARSAASYEPTAKFKTWLFTMARNRVIDHVRTAKNHASIDAENEEGESMFSDLAAERVTENHSSCTKSSVTALFCTLRNTKRQTPVSCRS